MTARRNRFCRQCGADRDTGAVISKQGYCKPCGEQRVVDSIVQQVERDGPFYDRWQAAMADRLSQAS